MMSLLLMLLFAHTTWAAPVKLSTASQTAQKFLQQYGKQLKSTNAAYAPRMNAQGVQTTAPYYVFNAKDGNGFVIVSGDDRTSEILGYSTTGSFDIDKLSANMRSFMDGMAKEISLLDKYQVKKEAKAPAQMKARTPIEPLVKTVWNQDSPYNDLCPDDPYNTSVKLPTGCVATAMAQVMYKHQWPETVTSTIPPYTTKVYENTSKYGQSKYKTISVEGVPADTKIDWANIEPIYNSQTPAAKNKAIAELMIYVGRSVKMAYDRDVNGGSGAAGVYISTALNKYFDYNASYIVREDYSLAEFENRLYNELAADRPVVFCGQSTGGGHCFVLDGYDGKGYFHVNWGWGGDSNGYFKVAILNPESTAGIGASSTSDGYAMGQSAIIEMYPNTTGQPVPLRLQPEIKRVSKSGNSITYTMSNFNRETVSVETGLGKIEDDGSITLISGTSPMTVQSGYLLAKTVQITGLKTAGVYKVTPIQRPSGSTGRWFYDPYVYVTVTVSDAGQTSEMRFNDYGDYKKLRASNFVVTTGGVMGKLNNVNVTVKNTADHEVHTTVYLIYETTNSSGQVGRQIHSQAPVTVPANSSIVLPMSFYADKLGDHNVNLCITENYQNFQSLGGGKVTVVSASTAQESLSYQYTFKGGTNNTIYGNRIEGSVRITNNGKAIFHDQLMSARINMSNQNDQSFGTPKDVVLNPGESTVIDFTFKDCAYSRHAMAVAYIKGSRLDVKSGSIKYVNVSKGFIVYNGDGSRQGHAPAATVQVPAEAAAVDLRGIEFTSVTPNSNPNTLYYVDAGKASATGLPAQNVVVSEKAAKVVLTDGNDFYCPETFTADEISYTRKFDKASDGKTNYEGLYIPFTPTSIMDGAKALAWQTKDGEAKDFFLMQYAGSVANKLNFVYADETFNGNIPYLMAVPQALVGKNITFNAKNVKIADNATRFCSADNSHFIFSGISNKKTLAENDYALSADAKFFELKPTATVDAFRAYIIGHDGLDKLEILFNGDFVTGINGINNNETEVKTVYDLQGRRLPAEAATKKGVYIINGKKVVVK
ncbi:C10 family peptidase [Prevotella falsenii]